MSDEENNIPNDEVDHNLHISKDDVELDERQTFEEVQGMSVGRLYLLIKNIENAPGKTDDEYYVEFGDVEDSFSFDTRPCKHELSPFWNEEFKIYLKKEDIFFKLKEVKGLSHQTVAKGILNQDKLKKGKKDIAIELDSEEFPELKILLNIRINFLTIKTPDIRRLKNEKMPRLRIQLQKFHFLPGDTIEGDLTLNTRKIIKVKKFCVRLVGIEKVHWTTGSGRNTHHHIQEVIIYVEEKDIDISNFGNEENILNPGCYEWNIKYVLPLDVCTSFQNNYYHNSSSISYQIIGIINKGKSLTSPTSKLNQLKIYIRAPTISKYPTQGYIQGHKFPITLTFEISSSIIFLQDISGIINCNFTIKNEHIDSIKSIKIFIQEHHDFRAFSSTQSFYYDFLKLKIEQLIEHNTEFSINVPLYVGEVSRQLKPTTNGNNMNINHNIVVILVLKKKVLNEKKLKYSIPITVGYP